MENIILIFKKKMKIITNLLLKCYLFYQNTIKRVIIDPEEKKQSIDFVSVVWVIRTKVLPRKKSLLAKICN